MKRNVTDSLSKWKNDENKTPLLLIGGRHTGKSYSIIDFGKQNYDNIVYLNFETDVGLKKLFNDYEDITSDNLILDLASYKNTKIDYTKTLLIFDEIEYCEKALSFFYNLSLSKTKYSVLASSSVVLKDMNSYPLTILHMYPYSFDEFLRALDKNDIIELIKEHYETNESIETNTHNLIMKYFRIYLTVGGYPGAVKTYIDTKDFDYVRATLSNLNYSFITDMIKYAFFEETKKAFALYDSVLPQLFKVNNKFQYSDIVKGARSKDYENALSWLECQRAILKCNRIDDISYPIDENIKASSFKLYYSDVGLLNMNMGLIPENVIKDEGISDKARSALKENYVAQALSTCDNKLYHYSYSNYSDVDFIIEDNKNKCIIPLATKPSDNLIKSFMRKYDCPYGINVSEGNFSYENNIKSIPLYALFMLKNN